MHYDLSGWTALVAITVIVFGVLMVLWMILVHHVNVKFGPLVVETHKAVKEINKAVNNVPSGAPTLVARVTRLERSQRWQSEALTSIADYIGAELPDPP